MRLKSQLDPQEICAIRRIDLNELVSVIFPARCLNRNLALFSARFDESRDTKTQRTFAIAGYFGRVEDWLELEARLELYLTKHGLRYFKASECESLVGEFLRFRGNPRDASAPLSEADRKIGTRLKTEFIDAVNSVNLWGIGAEVPIDEFNQVISSDPKARRLLQDDPYFICFQCVLMESGFMTNEVNRRVNWRYGSRAEMIAFVFDENEEMSGRAKQMYDRFQEKNPASSECFASMSYASDIKLISLQASDNLAYEVMKLGLNSRYDKGRLERKSMTRLKEKTSKIYAFDKPTLELLVRHNLEREALQDAIVQT